MNVKLYGLFMLNYFLGRFRGYYIEKWFSDIFFISALILALFFSYKFKEVLK